MNVPLWESRLIIVGLTENILRTVQQVWFPDLQFSEAVEHTLITSAIVVAQAKDKPLTVTKLAKYLEMPRATLQRRLKYLCARGLVMREGNHLFFNVEVLARTPQAIARSRQLILAAAEALCNLSSRPLDPLLATEHQMRLP
jgi:hypothetical protein